MALAFIEFMDKPRFKKGDTARILQYISPLPRGTTVAIVEINETRRGIKYLVEGKARGQSVRLWTKEQDLDLPFV